jgi:hypothetical protein
MTTLLRTLLLLSLLLPGFAMAANVVGEIILARGNIELQRVDSDTTIQAKLGEKIYLNDRIITQADGFAKLLLKDKSILKVSPSSELTVSIQLLGTEDKNTTINLLRGKIRSLVVEKLGANSSYEIRTAVAVAGVRGTDFEVEALDNTIVRCFTGKVNIANIDPAIKGSVLLGPNTYTSVRPGLAPAPVLPIPPSYYNNQGPGSDPFANDGVDQTDIDEIISTIYDQTIDGILDDDTLLPDIDPNPDRILDNPLFGDNMDGRIDQLPDTGLSIPFTIIIPLP